MRTSAGSPVQHVERAARAGAPGLGDVHLEHRHARRAGGHLVHQHPVPVQQPEPSPGGGHRRSRLTLVDGDQERRGPAPHDVDAAHQWHSASLRASAAGRPGPSAGPAPPPSPAARTSARPDPTLHRTCPDPQPGRGQQQVAAERSHDHRAGSPGQPDPATRPQPGPEQLRPSPWTRTPRSPPARRRVRSGRPRRADPQPVDEPGAQLGDVAGPDGEHQVAGAAPSGQSVDDVRPGGDVADLLGRQRHRGGDQRTRSCPVRDPPARRRRPSRPPRPPDPERWSRSRPAKIRVRLNRCGWNTATTLTVRRRPVGPPAAPPPPRWGGGRSRRRPVPHRPHPWPRTAAGYRRTR